MVGGEGPVEVVPGHLLHLLVVQAQVVEDGDRFGRARLHRQLDVRQHGRAPALGHQQRPALPGGVDGEGLAVDDPDTGRHRVDPKPVEGQIEEGHRRMHDQRDRTVDHRWVLDAAWTPWPRPRSGEPGTA